MEEKIGKAEENKEIFVFCRSGNKSIPATEKLIEYGYDAKNVLGGLVKYKEYTKKEFTII